MPTFALRTTLVAAPLNAAGWSYPEAPLGWTRPRCWGALGAEGTAIGVVADNLLRSATSAKYRRHLMSGDLALISPFNPEVRFLVGNAMARNKYIYCLAQDAIVVSSTPGNGGTWKGAVENLKRGWVPLWVKQTESPGSGNMSLVDQGGKWLEDFDDLVHSAPTNAERSDALGSDIQPSCQGKSMDHATELYEKVRSLVIDLCTEPKRKDDIAAALDVNNATAEAWIKGMVADGNLERTKIERRVHYVVREKGLFG